MMSEILTHFKIFAILKYMEIEEKLLIDLGLSQNESRVYLAVLGLGSDTVLNIAKKAGIKRPTCYLNLDNLLTKGYITRIETKNTTLYSAEKPSVILNKYKEKIDNFKDLLPFYEAKFNRGPKPKIRYYEGKEELWNVYTKIMFPSEELYFFGTDIEKVQKTFPDLFNYWLKKYHPKNKKTMEIVSHNEAGLNFIKDYGKTHPIRIMPKTLSVLADSVISENKIFIVSLDNLLGVLIESEDLAKTYKNFFLLAWQAAKKTK